MATELMRLYNIPLKRKERSFMSIVLTIGKVIQFQ